MQNKNVINMEDFIKLKHKKTRNNDGEHREQVALMNWAKSKEAEFPDLRWLYSNANGGKRSIGCAVKMKAEGTKRGVFDLFLPLPRAGFHGLYIEMKYGKNELSDEQVEFKHFIWSHNYCNGVFWNWSDASKFILDYLKLT